MMRHFASWVCAWLLLVTVAHGQVSVFQVFSKVEHTDRRGNKTEQGGYGTAVSVGTYNGESVLLSAGHNFLKRDPGEKMIGVWLRPNLRGEWFQAKLRFSTAQPEFDIAVLTTSRKLDAVRLAKSNPKPGDPVRISGWGATHNGRPVEDGGMRWMTPQGKIVRSTYRDALTADFCVEVGMSGGPVISASRECVGIVFARDDGRRECLITGVEAIRAFLQKNLGGIPCVGDDCQHTVPIEQPVAEVKPEPKEITKGDWWPMRGETRRCDCKERFARLERLIAELQARQPGVGPTGPQGPQGPQGGTGPPGKDGARGPTGLVDYNKLAEMISKELDGTGFLFTVENINGDTAQQYVRIKRLPEGVKAYNTLTIRQPKPVDATK